jgi:hypothetical protein
LNGTVGFRVEEAVHLTDTDVRRHTDDPCTKLN